MGAVATPHPGEPVMKVAAFQIFFHDLLDNRPPEAKFLLVFFVVDAKELFRVVLDHSVQGRIPGVTRMVYGLETFSHIINNCAMGFFCEKGDLLRLRKG